MVAVKLHILICHIESGRQLGMLNNPEEVKRITESNFFTGKQCVTVFDWGLQSKTMIGNLNQLTKTAKVDIMEKLNADIIPYDFG